MSDKCKHFTACIKKGAGCHWGLDQQKAFDAIKEKLSHPPVLFAPRPEDVLLLYLGVSEVAISIVVLCDDAGKKSHIFFLSRTMDVSKRRYSILEKLVLAVLYAKRHLKPFFDGFPIHIITDFPLRTDLSRPDIVGRISL